jgi:HKD family nuclease
MVSKMSVEILSELKETEEDYTNAVLGTFEFDANFFEDHILPILDHKDIDNIILLVDRIDYENSFKKAKRAEVRYFIEPVSITNTFHPKFILLTSDAGGKLILGSANITLEGFTRNAEILTSLEYSEDNPSQETFSVFHRLKEFLCKLIEKGFVRSEKHAKKILEAIDVPWLKNQTKQTEKVSLIHNLDEPILQQLRRILKGIAESVTVCSFLFSPEVIRYICENICKNVKIVLQPEKAVGVSASEIKKIIRDTGAVIDFRKVLFKGEENRFLHAKIFLIQTTEGSYCLTGSPNVTPAALLSKAPEGNVELCLLRYEKDKNHFEYLFNNDVLSTEKIDLSKIRLNPLQILISKKMYDFDLTEAKIEGDFLILEFTGISPEYSIGSAAIHSAIAEETITLNVKRNEQNRVKIRLDSKIRQFCTKPCYVILELWTEKRDRKITSSGRWISSDIVDLKPSRRDVERIRKTDGREGLIKLLNQLEKLSESPELFLYYLQFIDFSSLYDTIDSLRRRIMRRVEEESEENQIPMLDRQTLTWDYVLDGIVKKHLKRFYQLTEEVGNFADPHTITKIFNLFMFINKLIIWQTLRSGSVSRLIKICGSNGTMERFCITYLDNLRRTLGYDQTDTLMNKLDALIHVMILSTLIPEIQRRHPEYIRSNVWETPDGKRVGPLVVFEEIYSKCIKNLCRSSNYMEEVMGKSSRLVEVLKEYEEFEDIHLDAEKVINRVLKILEEDR